MHTCEDCCVRSSKIIQRYSSILDGFVGNFQKHALLRVHRDGFQWGNVEESVVKFVDDVIVKHVGFVDVGEAFAWTAVRMIEAFTVEASDLALDIS